MKDTFSLKYPYHDVTSTGDVYSKYSKKFIKLCKDKDGYAICGFTLQDGRRISKRVHRLVAERFIPNPDNKPFVNHKDGNKFNNNVNNLEWCTAKENRKHAVDTGLLKDKGEDNGNSKLTHEDVYRIRILYQTEAIKQSELALIFGVTQGEIKNVVNRNNWKLL